MKIEIQNTFEFCCLFLALAKFSILRVLKSNKIFVLSDPFKASIESNFIFCAITELQNNEIVQANNKLAY